MREKTCFEILAVSRDASLEEAKQAYKHLVKRWHPDQYGNDPEKQRIAQERLKEINVAYRELIGILKNTPGSDGFSPESKTGGSGTPGKHDGHFKKTTFFKRMMSFFQSRPGVSVENDVRFDRGHSAAKFGNLRSAGGVSGSGKPSPDFSQVLRRTLGKRPRGPGSS